MKDNLKGKWLKIWDNWPIGSISNEWPTYLVLAESVDCYGITGPYITLSYYDGNIYQKSKTPGSFNWNWIRKIEVW